MYARRENNVIVPYRKIPALLHTPNGIVCGLHKMSNAAIAEYGFYPLVVPSYDPQTHKRIDDIEWNDFDNVYEYTIVPIVRTVEEYQYFLLDQLNANLQIKQFAGFAYGNVFIELTPERKQDVADYHAMIEKEKEVAGKRQNYTKRFTACVLTNTAGSQTVIPLTDFEDFFLDYGFAYGSLKLQYAAKKVAISAATSISDLEQIDTSL